GKVGSSNENDQTIDAYHPGIGRGGAGVPGVVAVGRTGPDPARAGRSDPERPDPDHPEPRRRRDQPVAGAGRRPGDEGPAAGGPRQGEPDGRGAGKRRQGGRPQDPDGPYPGRTVQPPAVVPRGCAAEP